MGKIFNFIRDHFYILITVCMFAALSFPSTFKFLYPYLEYILMTMLFVSFLKTDFAIFSRLLKNPIYPIIYAIFNLIFIPVIFWFGCFFLSPDLRLAILLIVVVPQGVSTPSLIDLIGGKIETGISCLIISYLVAPFTIVGIFKFLAKVKISISYTGMFLILLKMIFIPLLLAWIIKKLFSDKTVKKGEAFYTLVTISMMACLTLGTFSHQSNTFINGGIKLINPLILVFLIFGVLFLAGFLFSKMYSNGDSITPVITTLFTNNTLAIVLASKFFPEKILFIALLTMIPWMLFLFPVKVYARRLNLSTTDKSCQSK